ncbi:hypothetical protein KRX57_03500 [Weeksellaceae bacterium TAE3-ERU29]|nr:hypothetical protein [Weeksellaceae bacterium TAE3-ERU29]
MINTTDIVTANFTKLDELLDKGYICVSIVGKVYEDIKHKEKIERIRGLNTFRMYYHIRSKDYYACYYLYNSILERKGIELLSKEINQLLVKHNKTKIALCDNSVGSEFGFRHILRYFLLKNKVEVRDIHNISLKQQKQLWKEDNYKKQGHYNLDNSFVGQTLEKCTWIYAKTAKNNPHWYTLRSDFTDHEIYLHIVSHIRYFGKPEIFEGVLYRVYYYNGYKYWDHPCDSLNKNVDLINRAILVHPKQEV